MTAFCPHGLTIVFVLGKPEDINNLQASNHLVTYTVVAGWLNKGAKNGWIWLTGRMMYWRIQDTHTHKSSFAKADYRHRRTAHLQVLSRSGSRKTFRTWKQAQGKVWTFPINRELPLSDGYPHELSRQLPAPCPLPPRASLLR